MPNGPSCASPTDPSDQMGGRFKPIIHQPCGRPGAQLGDRNGRGRQPRQGRGGAGGAECEPDLRAAGNRGPGRRGALAVTHRLGAFVWPPGGHRRSAPQMCVTGRPAPRMTAFQGASPPLSRGAPLKGPLPFRENASNVRRTTPVQLGFSWSRGRRTAMRKSAACPALPATSKIARLTPPPKSAMVVTVRPSL